MAGYAIIYPTRSPVYLPLQARGFFCSSQVSQSDANRLQRLHLSSVLRILRSFAAFAMHRIPDVEVAALFTHSVFYKLLNDNKGSVWSILSIKRDVSLRERFSVVASVFVICAELGFSVYGMVKNGHYFIPLMAAAQSYAIKS